MFMCLYKHIHVLLFLVVRRNHEIDAICDVMIGDQVNVVLMKDVQFIITCYLSI